MAAADVRAARPDEAATLTALALRSKAHWGYDAAFMARCVAELTVTAALVERGLARVCERDGKVLGFILFDPVGQDEAELFMIFVEPSAIGQGIGAALVRSGFAELARRGVTHVTVSSDPNAEAFYRRCGFVPIGTAPSGSIPGRILPRLSCRLDQPPMPTAQGRP